ncbi:cytochrome P450 [Krasilnikovia sp. MM14-A1259]|uniref:cytochrome P450 n=1 Tax=Krasilnikovia sp. MM14-A1259 TaxID=3373539 RepID=UPI003830220B
MSETDGKARGGDSVIGFRPRRMWSWVTRRLAVRAFGGGVDLSDLSRLPDSVLWPLRRDGLDPVPELSRRREQEPVSPLPLPFGVRAWLVTGYDEVKAVLGHVDGFSNDFANLAGIGARHDPGGLGFADPPVHTRLRRLLAPEFTMRRLRRLAPRIQTIVDEVLDAIEPGDAPVDLWRSFALPIPSLTICELLGVPYGEREHFQRLATARFDLTGAAGGSLTAMSESLSYLSDLVTRQRQAPGDGLLGMLIREHGDAVDDRELAGLADGLLTGGLETTASMLALGALVIAREPRAKRLLTGVDPGDHGSVGGGPAGPFVEELLRYLSVVQVAFPRCAVRDIQLGNVRIAAGDFVACSLSAANRADVFGADPQAFDPARPARPHLAFGHGAHRCIGAELARMELHAAYPALVRRFPRMRLAIDPGQLSFRDASIVFGLQALPVLVT